MLKAFSFWSNMLKPIKQFLCRSVVFYSASVVWSLFLAEQTKVLRHCGFHLLQTTSYRIIWISFVLYIYSIVIQLDVSF